MSSKKPIVIYPEYFDYRLKRSEGRRVPLSEAVKSPKVEELSDILSNLSCTFQISESHYSSNWSNMGGSLKVSTEFSKTQLIHKLGSGLKKLRKTN
tara:strand:+ start:3872 stop:4159 length:288 start_codon:yes stop_codon:yes gene_type:complete